MTKIKSGEKNQNRTEQIKSSQFRKTRIHTCLTYCVTIHHAKIVQLLLCMEAKISFLCVP